ncbi:MAG: PH domain-containing protein [Bacteroidota bacterium]
MDNFTKPTTGVVICFAFGLIMLGLPFILPRRIKDKYRHIPGLLLIAAGGILYWNCYESQFAPGSPWAEFLSFMGVFLAGLGLIEPLLNIRPYLYFSKNGIRFRTNIFFGRTIAWEDIRNVDMGDKHLEITLNNRSRIVLHPERRKFQHLRAHVDAMIRLSMR